MDTQHIQYDECIEWFKKGDLLALYQNIQKIHTMSNVDVKNKGRWQLLEGIVQLNARNILEANRCLWRGFENEPTNCAIASNILEHLPKETRWRRYVVHLEGYYKIGHSFSILFEQLLSAFSLMPSVDICCTIHNLNGMFKLQSDKSIFERYKSVDEYLSTKDDRIDLTIRIVYPPILTPNQFSAKTLVFVVAENVESVRYMGPSIQSPIPPTVSVMTPSLSSKQLLTTHSQLHSMQVVPHGYTPSHCTTDSQYVRRVFDCEENDILMLHVSSNTKNKNVESIVWAFEQWHEKHALSNKNIKYVLILKFNKIYDSVTSSQRLKEKYKQSKHIHVVMDTSSQEEMNTLYDACDVYVSPYLAEGFNMPALDAACRGKAIICPTGKGCPTDEFIPKELLFGVPSMFEESSGNLHLQGRDVLKQMERAYNAIAHDAFRQKIRDSRIVQSMHDKYSWKSIAYSIYEQYVRVPYACDMIFKVHRSLTNKYRLSHSQRTILRYYSSIVRRHNKFFCPLVMNAETYLNYYFVTRSFALDDIGENTLNSDLLKYDQHETNTITDVIGFSHQSLEEPMRNIILSLSIESVFKSLELIYRDSDVSQQINRLVTNFNFEDVYTPLTGTAYFMSTYMSKVVSKNVKTRINRIVRAIWQRAEVRVVNRPRLGVTGKPKLAMIGQLADFSEGAVARFGMAQYIALSKLFELYIFVFKPDNVNVEKSELNPVLKNKVEKVITICTKSPNINSWGYLRYGTASHIQSILRENYTNLDQLLDNEFTACFFPAVGCEIVTLLFSNLRIAPIQFSGYTHPVSTFGSCNTHFMMSRDFEVKEKIEEHYSENPIFIKGFTTDPIPADLLNVPIDSTQKYDDGYAHVMVSSNIKKITPDFLKLLESASIKWKAESNRPIHYHFFVGPCDYLVDSFHIAESVLHSDHYKYTFHPSTLKYTDYLRLKAKCHIGVDSYPYSGCTTLIESMHIGVPTVVMEDDYGINRCTTYLYKCNADTTSSVHTLIANSDTEYVDIMLDLLRDRDKVSALCKDLQVQLLRIKDYHTDIEDDIIGAFQDVIKDIQFEPAEMNNLTDCETGRLVFQGICESTLSVAHDVFTRYDSSIEEVFAQLGLPLPNGKRYANSYMHVRTDEQYLTCLQDTRLVGVGFDVSSMKLNTRAIHHLIQTYFRTDEIQKVFCESNKYAPRIKRNKDVLVDIHCRSRLEDIFKFVDTLDYSELYVGIDDEDSHISMDTFERIVEKYPHAKKLKRRSTEFFLYGSTCSKIVLSHGFTSALLGYLAYESSIHYFEDVLEDYVCTDRWTKVTGSETRSPAMGTSSCTEAPNVRLVIKKPSLDGENDDDTSKVLGHNAFESNCSTRTGTTHASVAVCISGAVRSFPRKAFRDSFSRFREDIGTEVDVYIVLKLSCFMGTLLNSEEGIEQFMLTMHALKPKAVRIIFNFADKKIDECSYASQLSLIDMAFSMAETHGPYNYYIRYRPDYIMENTRLKLDVVNEDTIYTNKKIDAPGSDMIFLISSKLKTTWWDGLSKVKSDIDQRPPEFSMFTAQHALENGPWFQGGLLRTNEYVLHTWEKCRNETRACAFVKPEEHPLLFSHEPIQTQFLNMLLNEMKSINIPFSYDNFAQTTC